MPHNTMGFWDEAAAAEAYLHPFDNPESGPNDAAETPLLPPLSGDGWLHMSRRALWITLGALFVLIGAIGVFLPLIPTTGPLIVAAWAFAKGSPRLHRWLVSNRLFGPFIVEWETYGVIKPRAKLLALVSMGLASAWMVLGADMHWMLAVLGVGLCAVGATYVATRPSSHPAAADADQTGS